MSKAFTKEDDRPEAESEDEPDPIPQGQKNYVTPAGFAALQGELRQLMREERPKIVEIVAWAAGNGDRSENGDYIYGKKRLREIDRRIRYLTRQLDRAEVVDPERQQHLTRVHFGATVRYARADGSEHCVTLVGIDEADAQRGKISWLSPLARALMKREAGDEAIVHLPGGSETIELLQVVYR